MKFEFETLEEVQAFYKAHFKLSNGGRPRVNQHKEGPGCRCIDCRRNPGNKPKGLAAMSPERRKEISALAVAGHKRAAAERKAGKP